MGAGERERALRAAWTGAALALGMTEAIGLLAAAFPHVWLSQFGTDPAMLEAGSEYLRIVGPLYGFFGLGLVLYFASQGAGRLLWPVIGNLLRLVVVAGGGWAVLYWGGDLTQLFTTVAVALLVYGLVVAGSIAGGAWFGPVGWPCSITRLLRRAA
jgi:Na+-driven multidrug efflux pump